jgi:sortase A
MRDWERMNESRRFLLLVMAGLLLFAGLTVAVLERTDPAQASTDSPVLSAAAPETTTTAEPAPTVPPETVPPAPAAASAAPAPAASGGAPRAVAPPRNSYAPEPIQEIGTIEIPKIGLVHKVMHGITLRNIDHGPSHWPGTPFPGEQGNSVFAGHRVTHTHPFRRIDELTPGDEIFFTIAGVRSRYVVSGSEIVSPKRIDIVDPTPTPTLTIFACHPPGSAKQRYVVRADLVPAEGSQVAAAEAAPAQA